MVFCTEFLDKITLLHQVGISVYFIDYLYFAKADAVIPTEAAVVSAVLCLNLHSVRLVLHLSSMTTT